METHILDLPDSLLLHVLGHLSHRQLLLDVGPVCQRFYSVSRDPKLWRKTVTLDIPSKQLNDQLVGGVVRWGQADVTRLRIRGQTRLQGSSFAENIDLFLNLRSLDLSGCSNLRPHPLAELLGKCGYRLHTLVLDDTDLPDLVMEACEKHAAPRVRVLSLRRCRGFTHKGLETLLQKCKAVQVLFLDSLTTKVVDPVFAVLCGECSNLRQVSVSECINLSEAALVWPCMLPYLQSLDLSGLPGLDATVCSALATRAKALKKLCVNKCLRFGDEALQAFVNADRDCHLEILECRSTAITNIGVRQLCRSNLGQRLRQVDVSDCLAVSKTAVMYIGSLSKMERVVATHVEPCSYMEETLKQVNSVDFYTGGRQPDPAHLHEDHFLVSRESEEFCGKEYEL